MKKVVIMAMVGILLLSVFTVFLPVKTCKAASGNTLYVGGSGPGNYSSIRSAIGAASEGDTVFVCNGTYYENVVVNKTVNLAGENKETTIVDGGGWFGFGYVFKVTANRVNISGFTIKNSTTTYDPADSVLGLGVGIIISANNTTVLGNIITENTFGISIENSFNNKVTTNIILNNGDGIGLLESSENIIENNVITDHNRNFQAWGQSFNNGVSIMYNAYNNTIVNNTISNNSGIGIHLSYLCENNSIYYNNFINNSENVNDSCNNNSWDNGQYGNYWDDYNGTDVNGDGIGDTPYNISGGNNKDKHPIMKIDGRRVEPTTKKEGDKTPGFELILFVCAIALVLLWRRKRIN